MTKTKCPMTKQHGPHDQNSIQFPLFLWGKEKCTTLCFLPTTLNGRHRRSQNSTKHAGRLNCSSRISGDFWGQTLKRVVILLCYCIIFEITRFYLSKGPIRIPIVNQAARTSRSEGEVHQNAQSLPLRTHTPGHHASNSPEPRQSSRPATSTRNGGPSAEHSAAPA